MRTFFGEVAIGPSGPAVEIACFDDRHNTLILGLVLIKLYLKIPLWFSDGYDIERGYGFSFTSDGLHWHWGEKTRVFWYPWTWDHHRTTILRQDGTAWQTGNGLYGDAIPPALKEQHRYNYLMRDGTVQSCIATVYGDEMEWRLRCAQWLPWPRKVRRSINVSFSAALGPGVNTWKGGVLGTGYDWKEGETMQQALRKMERAVIFGR
jgi:hypothetical protein